MAKPYSDDLRARVIAALEDGATLEEAGERHHVSLSSVGRSLDASAKPAASIQRNSVGTNRMRWPRMRSGSGSW